MVVVPDSLRISSHPQSIYISKEKPSTYLVHALKLKSRGDQTIEDPVVLHLKAEVPAEIATRINRLWEAVLRGTKYQEPKGENGVVGYMIHGSSFYFGFARRYFGKVDFVASKGALLIQRVGLELWKYAQQPEIQKKHTLNQISSMLESFENELSSAEAWPDDPNHHIKRTPPLRGVAVYPER